MSAMLLDAIPAKRKRLSVEADIGSSHVAYKYGSNAFEDLDLNELDAYVESLFTFSRFITFSGALSCRCCCCQSFCCRYQIHHGCK